MIVPVDSLWGRQIRSVVTVVANHFGIEAELLYQPRIPRELVRARRVVVYLLRMHYSQITLRTIVEHFGGQRKSAKASNDIAYLSHEMKSDSRLREDIRQLQQQLTNQAQQ